MELDCPFTCVWENEIIYIHSSLNVHYRRRVFVSTHSFDVVLEMKDVANFLSYDFIFYIDGDVAAISGYICY